MKVLTIEDIENHTLELENQVDTTSSNKGLFILKSGNQWLRDANLKPIPKQLFKEFWHQGELCILFADTNTGKSILAVQIADAISKGHAEAKAQPVLVCDFELSEKQFENRYSNNYQDHYHFHDNFLRIEINPEAIELPKEFKSFEDYLSDSLERIISEYEIKILVIDNITYLKSDTVKSRDALPLMKALKNLKSKYDLSILALAHTPKRDQTRQITGNDLAGSKQLLNFCDSAFAISQSYKDQSYRYLKQIKARNTEIIFGSENVCLYQIVKPDNFLQFDFIMFANEREHLKQVSEDDREVIREKIKELHTQGISQHTIAKQLNISSSTVNKHVNRL